MNLVSIFGLTLTVWVVIPLLIFCARIMDVSIGTLRLIFIARGMKFLAPLCGFFEVLIWLLAISQILQNLTHWVNYIAYAGGFAMGNYVGMALEGRLALGTVILRVITRHEAGALEAALRAKDYGVTSVDAEGRDGPVKILFMLAARNDIPDIVEIVHRYNPKAFYSIEDIRFVSEGVFPQRRESWWRRGSELGKFFRNPK